MRRWLLPTMVMLACGVGAAGQINWHRELATAQAASKKSGKPLLVYVYAQDQAACVEMERTTFPEAAAIEAVGKYEPLALDASKPVNESFWRRENAEDQLVTTNCPVYLFLSPAGQEYFRAYGFYPPALFVDLLDDAGQIIKLNEAIVEHPKDARAHADLGHLYLSRDMTDLGKPLLQKAVQLDPKNETGARADAELDLVILSIPDNPELAAGRPLRGKIIFESVVDEECNGGGAGTLACLDAGYSGDVAIFVDGNHALTMGCGGCLTADVFVEGQEGHAALGTGVSAIEKALVAKRGIDAFKAAREAERPNCRVNLGIFHAGVHPAVVPGAARLSLNIVYDYQEAVASRDQTGVYGGPQIRQEFERAIADAERGDKSLQVHPSRVEWVKDLIPYDQDPRDPWVRRFHDAFVAATGEDPVYDKMTAWSDAAHPAALFHIPTILYGPGVEGVAHSSEEYVPVGYLVECTAVLATFLERELGA